jgi:hypothetical protein
MTKADITAVLEKYFGGYEPIVGKDIDDCAEELYRFIDCVNYANKKVDIFLGQAKVAEEKEKSGEQWHGRNTFPEAERELLDTFVRITGIRPTNGALSDWRLTAGEWLQVGITSADVVAAWGQASGDRGFPCTRPGSLTGTAGMYAGKRRQQPSAMSTLDRIAADLAKARR